MTRPSELRPFVAANRFGLGSSRKDLAAIGTEPLEWLQAQLDSKASITIGGIASTRESIIASQQYLRASQSRNTLTDSEASKRLEEQRAYRKSAMDLVNEQITKRFAAAVTTELPVKERLAQFWSNHFTVSHQGKPQLATACAAFENEAIRPHLDGHFVHMLLSVASHPVMLMYLDNAQSIGPSSQVGRRRGAGINENYAREVLELHTLGVDGGYSQDDVIGLARMLTGWTIGNDRLARFGAKTGEFAFVEPMHEPGTHRLLGRDYSMRGREQGIEALKDLSLHGETARHIATKLVRHFVADTPEPRDIEYVADVYRRTDGHLPSIHKAAMTLASAWNPDNRKLKTPWELLVSMFRGLELPVSSPGLASPGLPRPGLARPEPLLNVLRLTNHLPFTAPSPAGWPDSAEQWGTPALLKQRIEFGIAAGVQFGNRIDVIDAAGSLVDPESSPKLLNSISRAESPSQGLSLLLSSPEFQWR
jgi:uncharacterized protein (DUF1800 family)